MSETASSSPRPLRIAIFGSGPSGFYAAEELLSQPGVSVDLFDRLPTPYGLVRGGVAPDHQKIKSVVLVFEKIASRPGFRFFGNVEFGRDLTLSEVRRFYDAGVFAVGAKSDRQMKIPGEDFSGSHAATEFVGWYNGHPDYRHFEFDLSCQRAAVIGNGNVAIDVVRILAKDPQVLANTDIAGYALEALRKSKIREVYMLGRRGPAQAAFTNPEIRELGHLEGADLVVRPDQVELDEVSQASLEAGEGGSKAKNNVQFLRERSQRPPGAQPRKVHVRFLVSPVEVLGVDGRVRALKLEKNKLVRDPDGTIRAVGTGIYETLEVGLVFRSIGYKGVPLPEIPFDDKRGTIPNEEGKVLDPQSRRTIPGLYVVGWAKRGPTGVIGTNKADSVETARRLLEDWNAGRLPGAPQDPVSGLPDLLRSKSVRSVSFSDWKRLDVMELERGAALGKVREKFADVPQMLEALRAGDA